MLLPGVSPPFFRGATVQFAALFYDYNNNLTTPPAPKVNIVYYIAGVQQSITIPMQAPIGFSTAWTAQWDTRGVDPGQIPFSVDSGSPTPAGVQDGQITLSANPANLLTF